MTLDADAIVARRRLRRRLAFWRVTAFGAAILTLFVLGARLAGDGAFFGQARHIARVDIEGFIGDDRGRLELLEDIRTSNAAKAVILSINSPGGTTAGAESLYEEIRRLAAEKPVVAVVGTMAASGGYIAALASDRIVARGNSITGSIGVVFQWAQFKQLLDGLGVKVDEVKSSPLKAEPSPFTETPAEARQVMEAMVADSYDWFVSLVAERRGLDAAAARRLGDGRVYTGRQALDNGLIDAIGGERQAVSWLESERGIDKDLDIVDWKSDAEIEDFGLLGAAARVIFGRGRENATAILRALANSPVGGAVRLDGLLSVWQAPKG